MAHPVSLLFVLLLAACGGGDYEEDQQRIPQRCEPRELCT